MEMVAQVYSSPELGCLVVELTRRGGDAFKFNELRENLAKQLGPIISGAADVKAIASKCVHGVPIAFFAPWTFGCLSFSANLDACLATIMLVISNSLPQQICVAALPLKHPRCRGVKPVKYDTYVLNPVLPLFRFLDRDAFDEDPEVMSFPLTVAEQQPELCATAQKRVGEEKLAERLEDVDVI